MHRLTRRELITTMLGAPLALTACRTEPPPLPPGELVEPSLDFGHRLRDGQMPPLDNVLEKRVGVVIVGGGVAGLSAAWKLLRSGRRDFVLLEMEPVAGGTARSGSSPVCGYPFGAHYLPVPLADNPELITLLEEMQLVESRSADGAPVIAEQFLVREPEERIFFRGRWYEGLYLHAGASPDDLAQFSRFQTEVSRWAGYRDAQGKRAFSIPLDQSSEDDACRILDTFTMAEWLDREKFTSPRLRWLVEYACRDDYGLLLHQTSAWAGLFYFACRMSAPEAQAQPLIAWPEGNGRIIAHLLGKCRLQVALGQAAVSIEPQLGGGAVRVTALDTKTLQPIRYVADRVICAAPQFVARRLIKSASPAARAQPTAAPAYGAWLVANLFLKSRPTEHSFPAAWDNVLYESPSLGYVTATHQRGIDHGPTIWTYYYPLCTDDPVAGRKRLLELGRDDWAEVALSDLAIAHPGLRTLVERVDVTRWGHAMIQPRVGSLWSGTREAARAPRDGIHFAHSDLSGIALFEEAFAQGLRAADEVLKG